MSDTAVGIACDALETRSRFPKSTAGDRNPVDLVMMMMMMMMLMMIIVMMMIMMMIRFGLQGGLVHKVAQANHYFVVRWGISGH